MTKKDWRDGLYIAQPRDWEKIKRIISPYEGDVFPHLDDGYWQYQLDQGNIAYDNTGCIYVCNIVPDERDFEGYVELHKGDVWLRQVAVAANLKGTGVFHRFTKDLYKNFSRHHRAYCLIVESNEPVKKALKTFKFNPVCKYKKYGQIWMKDYDALREQKAKRSTT